MELCEPAGEIALEIAKASADSREASTFEKFNAPFRALRDRYPQNLFAHLRYQDAVNERGIEGHLREMEEEYLSLRNHHPDELMYRYLYARVLMGRNTNEAISLLESIASSNADYAPAFRTLAEIYGSEAFQDREKAKAARARFETLCPGALIERRPAPIPAKSALWARAESLLKRSKSDPSVPQLLDRALQEDEWRNQRVRPYDWYSPAFKQQIKLEMQLENWSAWGMLVQHYRKTKQPDRANQLLDEMEGRLARLGSKRDWDVYWTGSVTVFKLHSEAGQLAKARDLLARLRDSLKTNPDAKRAAELSQLKSRYLPRG